MAEQIPPHALSRASAYEWMGSLALLPLLTRATHRSKV